MFMSTGAVDSVDPPLSVSCQNSHVGQPLGSVGSFLGSQFATQSMEFANLVLLVMRFALPSLAFMKAN